MKVIFQALIKMLTVKSLVSGDKEGEMKLRFRVDDNSKADKLMADLNKLHRADAEVDVILGGRYDE